MNSNEIEAANRAEAILTQQLSDAKLPTLRRVGQM